MLFLFKQKSLQYTPSVCGLVLKKPPIARTEDAYEAILLFRTVCTKTDYHSTSLVVKTTPILPAQSNPSKGFILPKVGKRTG